MTPEQAQSAVATLLGHRFARPQLLQQALTHSSWANENPEHLGHYERLEFLGDAALGLLVSHMLLVEHPDEQEGALSRRRAQIVRKETLSRLARLWGLAPFVLLGLGQKEGGVADTILADVCEAVMGAVFLDGGFDALQRCFSRRLSEGLPHVLQAADVRDDKTLLQELCHRLRLPQPVYEVIASRGPAHARVFDVSLRLLGPALDRQFVAEGRSKKEGEQRCAAQALAQLRTRPTP